MSEPRDSVEQYADLPMIISRKPGPYECWCIVEDHHPFAILVPDEECGRHGSRP